MTRLVRLSLAMLPLLLGLVCLALFDASEVMDAPRVVAVEHVRPTRLVVFMIDSLDRRDVEATGGLPRLHEHLRRAGLHGPVRACVDGVTIPCVSAMITGFDHASGFSPLRNFGAARGLTERSILGALEARGHRVGYFGDPLLARALRGLTVVFAPEQEGPADDERVVSAALQALTGGKIELAFIHLLSLDETAHKFTASGAEYRQALTELDARLDRTLHALGPDDHVVVLGDHGHEETGRHSADIGTHTYAAYLGPRFARVLERPLVMTDHARMWSRLYGLRWGERSFADDYFEGKPLPEQVHTLAVRPRRVWPLLLAWLAAVLLAVVGARPVLPRRSLVWAVSAAIATMLLLSLLVPPLSSWLATWTGTLLSALAVGLAGAGVLWLATRARGAGQERDVWGFTLVGALLMALPTAEPTAGLKAPVLWLLALLGVLVSLQLRAGNRRTVLQACSALVVLFILALIRVREYLPRTLLDEDRGVALGLLVPAALGVAAVYRASGKRPALAALVGVIAAPLLQLHAGRWLIVPCALVLPLCFVAFSRARAHEAVCLLLPVASYSFFPHDSAQLASVAACWWLWASVPSLVRTRGLLVQGGVFVTLLWLSFWTAMSTRVGGIDYDFYFRWLPAGAGATHEAVQQGLLTACKCMVPAVFGALLARRADALPLALLKAAEQLTRARLALTIVFVIGLSSLHGVASVQGLYDGTQEVAFWLLMFAVLGLISAANQVGFRATPAA